MKLGLIGLSILLSCNSDETTERRDLKLSAIYREYEVTLDMDENTVYSEAYFRTSSSGSHVKLNGDDKVQFRAEGGTDETLYNFRLKRKQLYFGSKNIPFYISLKKVPLNGVTNFSWHWYDSETDTTFIDQTEVITHANIDISHEGSDVLDTLKPEHLEIIFDREIKDSETIRVGLTSNLNSLSYTFRKDTQLLEGLELINGNTLRISSEKIRKDSADDQAERNRAAQRRFGNTNVNLRTRELIPIIDSGQQNYQVIVTIIESEELETIVGKGGKLTKRAALPARNVIINF